MREGLLFSRIENGRFCLNFFTLNNGRLLDAFEFLSIFLEILILNFD